MNKNSRDPENFQEILNLYGTAETFIKEVELCASDIAFPAINQLRYAGHHLLKGLASKDQQTYDDELDNARDHCHRAMYESSEAGISYLLELLKTFEADYKNVPVIETMPDYINIRKSAALTIKKLSEGRLNRPSTEEQVCAYMEMFRDLKDGVDTLEASRSELNKANRKQLREDRQFTIRVVIGIAAALIALVGILLQIG